MKVHAVIFVHNPPQWKYPFSSLLLWPLIRLVTWSKWNHCALLCEENGADFIVEALGSGVTRTPVLDWYLRAKRDTEMIFVERYPLWLRDAIGIKYDYASLILWKLIKKLTGRWYGPKWEQARKAVFCSELCAMVIDCPHPWDVEPGELYEYMKEYEHLVK